MMHPRWLALPLAVLTGCATAPAPRLLSADLHVGSLDQRTSFELDDRGSTRAADRDAPDHDASADTDKKQRTRKLLYRVGLGALGFGILGTVGFGAGGRIVQAQLKNGYEDDDLTRDREDQLSTTGQVMNGLTIGSAVVGLVGIIMAATAYGVDHARCGDLRPRRKQCAKPGGAAGSTTPPSDGSTTTPEGGPAPGPSGPSPASGKPSGSGANSGSPPAAAPGAARG
jgi:hypothetical protein